MHNRTEQFLNDPVFPLLIRMSAPNTIAFFIQAIVVLAEVWFISKLGTTSLAAVAIAFPIIHAHSTDGFWCSRRCSYLFDRKELRSRGQTKG